MGPASRPGTGAVRVLLNHMLTSPAGVLARSGMRNRYERASRQAGVHWGLGSQSWLTRGVSDRSIARRGAWLVTETREEPTNRQGSRTGSQRTPPNALTSHTAPGNKPVPRGRLEQTPTEQSGHKTVTVAFNEGHMTARGHDATAAAITHAAAHLLARHQDATVGAVARATGVARGTIYRYFPTRQALLTAVVDRALLEADRRLTQANLAAVPVAEGLARAVRALVALGDDFLVLVRQRLLTGGDIAAFSAVVALLDRGRQQGDLRSDLPLSCQVEALFALVHACLRASELAAWGPEDISATALRLFLEGSKPSPTVPPR
jgi:TetR/AcrR family transcriptional repressor of mexCD-oprJ operon